MSESDEFQLPPGQRQLFIDDHGVAAVDDLTRVLHQPALQITPEGNVVWEYRNPHTARKSERTREHKEHAAFEDIGGQDTVYSVSPRSGIAYR